MASDRPRPTSSPASTSRRWASLRIPSSTPRRRKRTRFPSSSDRNVSCSQGRSCNYVRGSCAALSSKRHAGRTCESWCHLSDGNDGIEEEVRKTSAVGFDDERPGRPTTGGCAGPIERRRWPNPRRVRRSDRLRRRRRRDPEDHRRPNRVMSFSQLLSEVWGVEPRSVNPRRVRVAVSILRRLLGEGSRRPRVETVSRIGYRFAVPSP